MMVAGASLVGPPGVKQFPLQRPPTFLEAPAARVEASLTYLGFNVGRLSSLGSGQHSGHVVLTTSSQCEFD
jgi:hypothetical protein